LILEGMEEGYGLVDFVFVDSEDQDLSVRAEHTQVSRQSNLAD